MSILRLKNSDGIWYEIPTITSTEVDFTSEGIITALGYTPAAIDHTHAHDSTKVDRIAGKNLSTNDYTTEEKAKLASIAEGANVNVQANWNQVDNTADDYIRNKPTLLKGDPGNPGVYIGSTEPEDEDIQVWIDTSGTPNPTLSYLVQTLTSEQQTQARANIGAFAIVDAQNYALKTEMFQYVQSYFNSLNGNGVSY